MKGPIQSVEADCFVHATEDLDRVEGAVGAALSYSGAPEKEELEGHFGNKIVLLKIHLTGQDAARALSALAAKMTHEQKVSSLEVGGPIDQHSALFLRFDKQALVAGRVVPGSGDSLRVKVKPRGFVKGRERELYSRLLGEA